MKSFIAQSIKHMYVIALLAFTAWLFFFHLDYNTLNSWDEAWYGAIARDMGQSGDYLRMTFNGQPYFDHPPFGFWLMAVSYHIFGISEFSTRLPSVFAGIGGVLLLYRLCSEFFHRKEVGFVAAIILATSVWYTIRVRSGNLDAAFVFFYIATIYAAFKTTRSFWWFIVTGFAFGALVMTKTLAGISALVVVVWLIAPYMRITKSHVVSIILGVAGFFLLTYPWYSYHLSSVPGFYDRHFVEIGARNKSLSIDSFAKLQWELPMFYLHMGVRKWYYLWFLGAASSIAALIYFCVQSWRSHMEKRKAYLVSFHTLAAMIGWNIVILYPFLTTDLTQIWHLIPVYAPLAIITAYGLYLCMEFALCCGKRIGMKHIIQLLNKWHIPKIVYILAFCYIAFVQIRIFYIEVFPANRHIIDEADIFTKAAQYKMTIYSDRDYIPVAVYYSQNLVHEYTREATGVTTIQKVFDTAGKSFGMVVQNGTYEEYVKAGYEVKVLAKNNSFTLITRK